jgi:hypothetical protein
MIQQRDSRIKNVEERLRQVQYENEVLTKRLQKIEGGNVQQLIPKEVEIPV